MSFGEHLDELRRRLMKATWVTAIGVACAFWWCRDIMLVIVLPYRDAMTAIGQSPALMVTGPAAGIFAYLKVSLIVGLIVMAPYWIWQLWGFVAAGLYTREKKQVYNYAPLCLVLFLGGVLFGYFVLIPIGLQYMLAFPDPDLIQNMISLSEYLSLFTLFTLVLGLTFQIPTVMIGLARFGLVEIHTFREKRRWVILIIFIVSAVLTPPDPLTQSLLAIPLCLLYELGIFIAWMGMGSKRPPIDRAAVRRNLLKLAVVGALVFVFWQNISDFWQSMQADERRPVADGGFRDAHAIIGAALQDEIDVLLAANAPDKPICYAAHLKRGERTELVRLTQERRTLQVVDRNQDQSESVLTWTPAGTTVWKAERLDRLPYDEFLPGLLQALRFGTGDVSDEARTLLKGLLDEAGMSALSDDPAQDEAWMKALQERLGAEWKRN